MVFSQTESTNIVQKALDNFVKLNDLKGAAISFAVIDLSTGSEIATHNQQMGIIPASTVKLFTTATAFEYLGPYNKPITRLYYTGNISGDGVLDGNIIIRGGGDPTLGSRFYSKEGEERSFLHEWAKAVKELGIVQINGYVIADASDFGYDGAPAGWTWGDMGNYYGAWASGLSLFDNMTYLYFNTSATSGDSTELYCIDPHVPGIEMDNRVRSGNVKGDNAYVFGAPYSREWFVEGQLPLGQAEFKVKAAIPDPEEIMSMEFTAALKDAGIQVKYRYQTMRKSVSNKNLYYKDSKLIMEYLGKDINNISHWVNQRSVNLYAEHLLCLVGLKRYGKGNTSNGTAAVLDFWKGKIDVSTLRLTDGSGLSRNNAVSANHFVQLLKYMNEKGGKEFEKTLPIAGKTGTLASVCQGQAGQGRVVAKSGTMSRIKSYAGYVNTKTGKKLAFALIVNNHTNSSSALTKQIEALFNAMSNY